MIYIALVLSCNGITFDSSLSWTTVETTLPTSLFGASSGLWNETIYIIGGDNTTQKKTTIYSANLHLLLSSSNTNSSNIWLNHGNWKTDSEYGAVVNLYSSTGNTYVSNLLFIVQPVENYGLMFIYNMNTSSQVNGTDYNYSVPRPVRFNCATNNGTHVFVLGGHTGGSFPLSVNHNQIYDIVNDVWSIGSPMYYNRSRAMCAYIEKYNSIYVFAGTNEEVNINNSISAGDDVSEAPNNIEIYRIKSDTWYLIDDIEIKATGSNTKVHSKVIITEMQFNNFFLASIIGGGDNTTDMILIGNTFDELKLVTNMSDIQLKPGGESVFAIIQINNTQFITLGGVIWSDVSIATTPYDSIEVGQIGFKVFTNDPTSNPTSLVLYKLL